MKSLICLLLLTIALPVVTLGQIAEPIEDYREENMRLHWSINVYRKKYKVSPLQYRIAHQYECDKRVIEIQKDFNIPEEGYPDICDGEVIFRDSTYTSLLSQMIDKNELYYNKDMRFVCVSMRKKENWFYVVVRMWTR